jgi:hypothetical protein
MVIDRSGARVLVAFYKVPNFSSGLQEVRRVCLLVTCWSNQELPLIRSPSTCAQDTIRDAYHYWGFAACAYGWMLLNGLFFSDKDTSILHGLYVGDDKNLTVLCDHTGIKPDDVLDACWTSSDYHPGHYVAVDHSTEAIVVVCLVLISESARRRAANAHLHAQGIRGTFHLKDALTDLVAHSTPIFVCCTTGNPPPPRLCVDYEPVALGCTERSAVPHGTRWNTEMCQTQNQAPSSNLDGGYQSMLRTSPVPCPQFEAVQLIDQCHARNTPTINWFSPATRSVRGRLH